MTTTVNTIGNPVPQTPPVVPNAGVVPLPYTKMPLFDWAARMGLNPVHFAGGVMSGRFEASQPCSSPWPRYTWQNGDSLSHTDVAIAISTAESIIEEYLGFHLAPATRQETWQYPRYLREHRTTGFDRTGRRAAIQMQRSKILSVSVEKRSYIGTFPVSYQDLDGDGYPEIAYVLVDDTADLDVNEVHLFPAGLSDHPSWQIRYPKRWGVTGDNRYFLFDFWLMVDHEVVARLPGHTWVAPNLDNAANLIDHVEAWRVWQDSADTDCVSMFWETPNYCAPGESQTSGGTAIVRDPELALVAPVVVDPSCLYYGAPDRATITYYSGARAQEFLSGYTLNPLGGHLADAVFYLATARLTRDVCGCAEARALAADLRKDMSLVSPQGNFLAVADAIQTSPFGTRRGEWLAYQSLKLVDRHMEVAVI